MLSEAPIGLDRWEALRQLHFPESWETLRAARPRLILEEFFLLQARLFFRKHRESKREASSKPEDPALLQEFWEQLPFALTEGQQEVWREIGQDLAASYPMRRLLQGDVGSGKTVVAAAAAVQTIAAGWQAAFMAPTQILAEQHHRTLSAWLTPLGLRVGLFTGARREVVGPADAPGSFTLENEAAELPDCDLLVGTHALLFEKAPVRKLGLVIIDEQHKFGVMQRQRLIERGTAPDVLVMSATPIPRTLTETVHGDLEVSLLRGRPAQRGRVLTAVRRRDRLPAIIEFLHRELAAGRQLFIVYPLIEESEKLGAKAATVEVENWKKHLAPARVEVLHGRIPPEEKERLMLRFAAQEFGVLVSTTVIEVGVDIPNATVMLIEDAERFGLAQLHQLRGRIGRGPYKSWCILLAGESAGEDDSPGWSKLGVLEKTLDGFEIAEADWALRGPGDMMGTAQSGLPPLRLGDLRRDAALMAQARETAARLFATDPDLAQARHERLGKWLETQETGQPLAAAESPSSGTEK
jgi:ATP-dependent DNA helicase RecG